MNRRCEIPAQILPPCDLVWGHDGDMHANGGDGFYAQQHLDEHHRRQAEQKLRGPSALRVNDDGNPTDVECPTCGAWKGWACEGADYGYHAAGYHPARERDAEHAAACKTIDLAKETP